MAELGGRQLCTFDPAGEFYASVSSDNRLRTWTTVRRRRRCFRRAVCVPTARPPHDCCSSAEKAGVGGGESLRLYLLPQSHILGRPRCWKTPTPLTPPLCTCSLAARQASGTLRHKYVEPRHLAKQYTSIAWYRPASKVRAAARPAGRQAVRQAGRQAPLLLL